MFLYEKISDHAKMGSLVLKRIFAAFMFSNPTNNNYPTVIGSIGTTSK